MCTDCVIGALLRTNASPPPLNWHYISFTWKRHFRSKLIQKRHKFMHKKIIRMCQKWSVWHLMWSPSNIETMLTAMDRCIQYVWVYALVLISMWGPGFIPWEWRHVGISSLLQKPVWRLGLLKFTEWWSLKFLPKLGLFCFVIWKVSVLFICLCSSVMMTVGGLAPEGTN